MARELTLKQSTDCFVAFVTCPNPQAAETLSSALVETGAAACVNIVPGLSSVYRWEGKVCRDNEILLIVKTSDNGRQRVAQTVGELHPYDEPELIFLPITCGSESYLAWLRGQVQAV